MEKGKEASRFTMGYRIAAALLVGLLCFRFGCMAIVAAKIKPVIAEMRENTVEIERQGVFNPGKLDLSEEEFNRFLTKQENIFIVNALPFVWGERCESPDGWITFHYLHGNNAFTFWGADVTFRNGSGERDSVGLTRDGFDQIIDLLEQYRSD